MYRIQFFNIDSNSWCDDATESSFDTSDDARASLRDEAASEPLMSGRYRIVGGGIGVEETFVSENIDVRFSLPLLFKIMYADGPESMTCHTTVIPGSSEQGASRAFSRAYPNYIIRTIVEVL